MPSASEVLAKTGRRKHELPSRKVEVVLIVTDHPAPGESYFREKEMAEQLMDRFRDMAAGISVKIKSVTNVPA